MTSSTTIYLERREPARNMARFYALALETDLLGDIVVVRRWGRIGAAGRQMTVPCPSRHAAIDVLRQIEHAKRRRGYRACG